MAAGRTPITLMLDMSRSRVAAPPSRTDRTANWRRRPTLSRSPRRTATMHTATFARSRAQHRWRW